MQAAVELLRAAFPHDSWEPASWARLRALLPHVLAVAEHAQRLAVGAEQAGRLLGPGVDVPARARPVPASPPASPPRGRRHRGGARPAAPRRGVAARHAGPGPAGAGSTSPGPATSTNDVLQIGGDRRAPTTTPSASGAAVSALVLQALGDLTGARTQHERALQIGEATLGPDHPTIGIRRNNLGRVLQDLGDLTGARTQYERALQISETALGPDHPTIGIRRNNLGARAAGLGDLRRRPHPVRTRPADRRGRPRPRPPHHRRPAQQPRHACCGTWATCAGARTQYERALQISETALGPDHPTIGVRRNNLGGVLPRPGGPDRRPHPVRTRPADQRDRPRPRPPRPSVSGAATSAACCTALGDLPGARTQYERALQISETALGPDHPQTRQVRRNLDDVV